MMKFFKTYWPYIAIFGAWVWLLVMFAGCKSVEYVPVETLRTDTTYITKTERDSIFKHDSIYIREFQRGETIYIDRTRWQTLYRDRILTDTLIRLKTDSIQVPYPVERQLSRWESLKMEYGGITIGATFLLVVLILCVVIYKFKRAKVF